MKLKIIPLILRLIVLVGVVFLMICIHTNLNTSSMEPISWNTMPYEGDLERLLTKYAENNIFWGGNEGEYPLCGVNFWENTNKLESTTASIYGWVYCGGYVQGQAEAQSAISTAVVFEVEKTNDVQNGFYNVIFSGTPDIANRYLDKNFPKKYHDKIFHYDATKLIQRVDEQAQYYLEDQKLAQEINELNEQQSSWVPNPYKEITFEEFDTVLQDVIKNKRTCGGHQSLKNVTWLPQLFELARQKEISLYALQNICYTGDYFVFQLEGAYMTPGLLYTYTPATNTVVQLDDGLYGLPGGFSQFDEYKDGLLAVSGGDGDAGCSANFWYEFSPVTNQTRLVNYKHECSWEDLNTERFQEKYVLGDIKNYIKAYPNCSTVPLDENPSWLGDFTDTLNKEDFTRFNNISYVCLLDDAILLIEHSHSCYIGKIYKYSIPDKTIKKAQEIISTDTFCHGGRGVADLWYDNGLIYSTYMTSQMSSTITDTTVEYDPDTNSMRYVPSTSEYSNDTGWKESILQDNNDGTLTYKNNDLGISFTYDAKLGYFTESRYKGQELLWGKFLDRDNYQAGGIEFLQRDNGDPLDTERTCDEILQDGYVGGDRSVDECKKYTVDGKTLTLVKVLSKRFYDERGGGHWTTNTPLLQVSFNTHNGEWLFSSVLEDDFDTILEIVNTLKFF